MVVVLLLIALVVIFIAVLIASVSGHKKSDTSSAGAVSVALSVEPTGGAGGLADVGPLTELTDSGWLLNPNAPFSVTLYGVSREAANEIRELLVSDEATLRNRLGQLEGIIARTNLHWKELDDYVRANKPKYLAKLEELKKSSSVWASASELDREDLLVEFRREAAGGLDVIPHSGVETLFEAEPSDATFDDALIDRFGYDNLRVYARFANNLKKVHTIPADHYYRTIFESLSEKGLALRGSQISVQSLVECLTLKEMNVIARDLGQSDFKRKGKAVEYLVVVPDIQERLSKVFAFRELFQLRSLPTEFANLELQRISLAWQYAAEVASLMEHTFVMARYGLQHLQSWKAAASILKGFELSPVGDNRTCQYCRVTAQKKFSRTKPPLTPLHIGCRCTILPLT